MQKPALCPDEPLRMQAVGELNQLDTPLEERFERITRLAQRALNVPIVAISLVGANRQWFKSIQGLDVTETSRDVSFCGHTILQSDLFVVPDARKDPRFSENPLVTGPPNIVFYAGCPIHTADGHKVGSLCLIDRAVRTLDEDDRQALQDFAALAQSELQSAAANAVQASLLENVDYEQRRALVDSLTRLWNREGIHAFADQVIDKVAEAEHGAALVMVDLDEFKPVNDSYGHIAGDEVLQACARRLLASIRDSDAVGRVGGDEFLIVLNPCDSAESAETIANRVRDRMVAAPIVIGDQTISITASLGVRFLTPGATTPLRQLIHDADSAMYSSKHGGRDCVSMATSA